MNLDLPVSVSDEPLVFRGRSQYVVGIEVDDMFIFEPHESPCGRFVVDPAEAYGLSPEQAGTLVSLNNQIHEATQAAIDAGCLSIQEHLGIESGDQAGVIFSEDDIVNNIGLSMATYLAHEINGMNNAEKEQPAKISQRQ